MGKNPKTLVDAMAALKLYATENGALNDRINEQQQEIAELQRRDASKTQAVRDAIDREGATRKQFEDLKERLHNSEIENARLRGYMERVREDDNVADPVVEIEGPAGKRFVSKRHPTPAMSTNDFDPHIHDAMASREKRKHWTSY